MEKKLSKKTEELFISGSIPKAVLKNCLPALIIMVMVMVYNLADTFFIGLTHDDLAVAAVSLGTPIFMIFMSIGTLFGVGGTSLISRALGAGKIDYAKKVSSFCMWASVIVGAVLMIVLWASMGSLPQMLGASPDTLEYTRSYLTIIVGCGIFSMISNCFSNVIRAEGAPMKAMMGTVVGNLLNIVLDPIMILGFGWGVSGAAAATVIGNGVAAAYYLLYFARGKSELSISPKLFSCREGIAKGVIAIGLSASLSNLLVSLSSILVNIQLQKYGDMYVAGYGVTSKVLMIVILVGIGVCTGVQPLFGYCFGAKNKERLMGSLRFSIIFGLSLCLAVAVLCFIFAGPIVGVFLTGSDAYSYGMHFTRILMTTAWLIGAFAVCQSALQAMGAATPALLAAILRQGIIFIPLALILNMIIGVDGLLWAQPVADVASLIIIALMLRNKLRKFDFTPENAPAAA